MSLTLTNVGVSDISRFQSDAPGGVVTAHVRLNFDEGGQDHQFGLAVDLDGTEDLTFSEIEAAAIREAHRVITLSAALDASEMVAMFRKQFEPISE